MIEEQAIVLSADPRIALVEAIRRQACGHCDAAAGCGTSLLDRFLGRRPLRIQVQNRLGVSAGDRVIIGVPEASMLRAAVAAYLGPLAGLILGALAGRHWLPGTTGAEWPTLVGAVIGFSIALRLVARYGHAMAKDPRFQPTLLRRSDSGSVSVTFG